MSTNGREGYRPELDGLRAVAVAAVLLYHLDLRWIPGGFTGVDVFFVLSGYLITGLLIRDLDQHTFRFRTFFLKRVRRLLPALLAMTFGVIAVAAITMLPVSLVATAKSAMAQPFAIQNVYFLLDGEYFANAKTKVLLHTWSLGIEEQFYVLWPLLLLGLTRLRLDARIALVAALVVASFVLNLLVMEISPKTSFFLLPTRAWELGLGGLLAFAEHRARRPLSGRAGTVAFVVGFAAVLVSFATLRGGLAFPGWWALVPALGTVAVVAGVSSADHWGRRALSLAPVVALGRVSYAVYLWHWPVIVFARRAGADPSEPGFVVLLSAVSLALAALSFRFVEEPIRRRRWLVDDATLVRAVIGAVVLLLACCALIVRSDGLAFRYGEPARSMLTSPFHGDGDDRCGAVFRATQPRNPICRVGGVRGEGSRRVLLWGNSHAPMWMGLFDDMGRSHDAVVFLTSRNCRPTADSAFCSPAYQRAVLARIGELGVTDVVLASSWHGAYGIADDVFEAQLRDVTGRLVDAGRRVWLVVDVPVGEALSPERQYRANPTAPAWGIVEVADHEATRQRTLRLFRELSEALDGVAIVDPTDAFCDPHVGCRGGLASESWYRDASHLTSDGAARARDQMLPIFTR